MAHMFYLLDILNYRMPKLKELFIATSVGEITLGGWGLAPPFSVGGVDKYRIGTKEKPNSEACKIVPYSTVFDPTCAVFHIRGLKVGDKVALFERHGNNERFTWTRISEYATVLQSFSNHHCFNGFGFQYWSALARGLQPLGDRRAGQATLNKSPGGFRLDFAEDTDGYAVQNGGMHNPTPVDLDVKEYYYRFIDSIDVNKYGADSGLSGGWWISEGGFSTICEYSDRLDWALAQAASRALIIPKEWGDCGYVGKAKLILPMKAFRGKGKPATGASGSMEHKSPDNALRRPAGNPVVFGAQHLDIWQYFVPGSANVVRSAFWRIGTCHVIKRKQIIAFE